MRLPSLVAGLLAIVSGASIATAQDDESAVEPASKWVLRSGENHCAIVKRFGQDRPIHLQIRKFPGDHLLEFTVLGRFHDWTTKHRSPVIAITLDESGHETKRLLGTEDSQAYPCHQDGHYRLLWLYRS